MKRNQRHTQLSFALGGIVLITCFTVFFDCKKKDNKNPLSHSTSETGTMTDQDGNIYKTVKIGDQWWMAENLKVTQYRNGDQIPNITDGTEWMNLRTGAYCAWENDSIYSSVYGYLYNWYAVDDSRNIAPNGWHVPTDDEWKTLEKYLGMSQFGVDREGWQRGTNEGGKLKEAGTIHWESPNTGATNESGFSALPSGWRLRYEGTFFYLGYNANFWTSTESDALSAWYRFLTYKDSYVYRWDCSKPYGYSIRLVMD